MNRFVCCTTGLLVLMSLFPARAQRVPFATSEKVQSQTASVDSELAAAIQRAFYKVRPARRGFEANNPAQHLHAEFTAGSAKITSGTNTLEMRLLDHGAELDTMADGPRLGRTYKDIREWFVNDRTGIEQGFALENKPAGPLALRIQVSRDWQKKLEGEKLTFTKGESKLQYSALKAWDARGAVLEARLQLLPDGFEILVSDDTAVYPVTIDPVLSEQATLTDSSATDFGYSVALSGDGNTALVGAPGTTVDGNVDEGAAFIFIRSNGDWTEQVLPEPSGAAGDTYGISVALSSDGKTAAVGSLNRQAGTDPNNRPGGVFIFKLNGDTWSQSDFLTDETAIGFGVSVVASGDGKTFLIVAGASQTAYIYGPIPTSIGFILGFQASFVHAGYGSSLNGDGSVAVTGGNAAFSVYTRGTDGKTWTLQQMISQPDQSLANGSSFGSALSLDNAGDTVLVGSPADNYGQGAVYVYSGQGSNWTEEAKLTDPAADIPVELGGPANDEFGRAVALSGDGTKALIGEDGKLGTYAGQGAAYLFSKLPPGVISTGPFGSWTASQSIPDPDTQPESSGFPDNFGWSVALNSDGTTALVGAVRANGQLPTNQGIAYVFYGVNIAINSTPAGLQVSSSGDPGCALGTYATPVTLEWVPGSACTLTFATPQAGAAGTQYVFTSWEDASTSPSRFIVAPSANATYSANFKTQYQLTTAAAPTTEGSISPITGFFDADSAITITATPRPGYVFTGFSGALTGATDPQTLTLTSPASVTANFKSMLQVLVTTVETLVANSNLPPVIKQLILNILGQLPTGTGSLNAAQRSAAIANLQALATDLRLVFGSQASRVTNTITQEIAAMQ